VIGMLSPQGNESALPVTDAVTFTLGAALNLTASGCDDLTMMPAQGYYHTTPHFIIGWWISR
jgi:hypothetical protein